jgi:hypothetical protein
MTGGGSEDARGLVPRALERVLTSIDRLRLQQWEYSVECSILEVGDECGKGGVEGGAREIWRGRMRKKRNEEGMRGMVGRGGDGRNGKRK